MTVRERIAERNPDALLADGFDNCILGTSESGAVVYSADAMLRQLVEEEGLSYEDALDHFAYNIAGAYVGEFTPIYLWPLE